MPTIRAQFVGQGASGFPEDRFINTFHFTGGVVGYEAEVDLLHPLLSAFYTEIKVGGATLSSYISEYVNRSATIRYYDLTTAEPRVPRVEPLTLTAVGVPTSMPEEVAACISMRGIAPVTARRRGRVFIGPLTDGAKTDTTPTTPTRLNALFQLVLLDAAEDLRQAVVGLDNGCVWSIRSVTPSENFVTITGGWVDDAFDTQRRRGPVSLTRGQWGIPL